MLRGSESSGVRSTIDLLLNPLPIVQRRNATETSPMRCLAKVREHCRPGALASLVCLVLLVFSSARPCAAQQDQSQQPPAPIERRPPPAYNPPHPAQGTAGSYAVVRPQRGSAARSGAPGAPRGEHLAQWMSQHSNLTPEQQQQALAQEPGFGRLPTETQQRMRERLSQLDAMPPTKRQRVLERTEAMERLAPEQRAEVRGAMSQLGALPIEQRRTVARTFRALHDLPPEQRQSALASGRLGPPLDGAQQAALDRLLRAEPLLQGFFPAQPSRAPGVNNLAPNALQPNQPVYPPQ